MTTESAKELVIEPPATVGLGLYSAAVHDVSCDFLFGVGVERVEAVVGQACTALLTAFLDLLGLSLIVCLKNKQIILCASS